MKQAKVLTEKEFKRALAICETMQNGKRNRLMLLLSHYAGLRVGEIASLK
jgi:integrase/recombinase XerD